MLRTPSRSQEESGTVERMPFGSSSTHTFILSINVDSLVLFCVLVFFVSFMSAGCSAKQLLGEVVLAFLGLDIIDIELCYASRRRTFVQVPLELLQSTALTLSFTGDLHLEVSITGMLEVH